MWTKLWILVMALSIWIGVVPTAAAEVKSVTVKTRAENNRVVSVWFRVPENYDARSVCRVLVIFGGRNAEGKGEVSGALGWGEWADKLNIFLVSPGFKDDDYWDPQGWSGKALQQALRQIKRDYNISIDKLMFYGYSAGSQASNLFAAWNPNNCRAWVSHACGVFHEPSTRMRNVPGLVTCGDADQARYIISRNFVENCRARGINIIWKSFPNHPHDVPPDSLALARAFLEYYHKYYSYDLTGRPPAARQSLANVAFVGDDQEHEFYPADSAKAKNVLPEDRVNLPDRRIAEAWGRAAQ